MNRALISFALALAALPSPAQMIPMGALPVATSGGGTITPQGTWVCGETAYTTSYSVSYAPHAAGDQVFVSYGGTATSITNNQSQTATNVLANSGGGAVWEFTSIASGVTTFTLTQAAAGYASYCIVEFSGVASIGNTSQGNVTTTGGSSPWAYTTSLSTTQANGYILAFEGDLNGAAETPTATSGTLPAYYASANHNNWAQYNTSATAGSVPISGTITGPASNVTLGFTKLELKH
jgi:hypothetical protein